MGVSEETMQQLIGTLVARGLGIYGRERMAKICESAGIALLDDDTTDWLADDKERALNDFLVNYAQQNIAARMTVMVLAKRHGVPIPDKIQRKKRITSRFRRLFRRK
ncbi:MAG: hypothetical protein K9W43_11455 [Candidatus Thorarchaeota archaeon]|nr:hypothetical protein [Candidatus Thorarchaeota archaeon]